MPNPSYTDHIEELKKWLQANTDSMVDNPEARTWCLLSQEKTLVAANIYEHFDNTDVNSQFKKEADIGKVTNVPVAYLQTESDNLNSLSKMYVYRHQPRLKNYRDDCENKYVRNFTSLSHSLAKLEFLKSLT